MASSNNLASLEPWSFRPTFSDSWFSDAFTRDTETLTRALQKSLANNNNFTEPETTTLINNTTSNNNNNNNNENNSESLYQYLVKSEQIPTPTGSVSDPDTNIIMVNNLVPKRRNAIGISGGSGGGKISKRKSRASKRSPTTFIAADPSNFRQMVQQVTGIQFNGQQTVTSVLKPEPHRPGSRIQLQQNYNLGLPTLDTSAFLLDNNTGNNNHRQFNTTTSNSNAPVVVVTAENSRARTTPTSSGSLDFGNYQSFPTLESWGV